MISRIILLAVVAGWAISQPGCSRPPARDSNQSHAIATQRVLSADAAAELAAKLANDRCERQYRKRPFAAQQHAAVLEDRGYRWGGLDVGGPGGLSALVTFARDGTEPHVEVYFSSDALRPPAYPAPAPPSDGGPRIK
jgi:hypothetical protein